MPGETSPGRGHPLRASSETRGACFPNSRGARPLLWTHPPELLSGDGWLSRLAVVAQLSSSKA